ncbi:hypothetical protein HNP84_002577 [Thermocatellispora tengchongensis]|uniref:Uncharacterized protein n=1 Tax=Thermocatellispora tengchongensis TaxID=1073253 RepID=A0A840P2Y2_9ACTN|nr:DUF6203 family protein [Thermocatellispora tengchongensis]MBB5132856.1 hypothetical protein [Thermocatellispora tengchongensis]
MKRILTVLLTRWLGRTPLGLAVLGVGWLILRRRRARAAAATTPEPYGRSSGRRARTVPVRRGRRESRVG